MRSIDSDACDLLGAGLFCVQNKCAKISFAAQGQPCGVLNGGTAVAICAKNAHCTLGNLSLAGTCDAPLGTGAACDESQGKKCSEPLSCLNGVCAERDLSTCK
jgi:hypothetical protein